MNKRKRKKRTRKKEEKIIFPYFFTQKVKNKRGKSAEKRKFLMPDSMRVECDCVYEFTTYILYKLA